MIHRLHGRVHVRRVRVLTDLIAPLVPQGASVLDVGCGDGLLARSLAERRPDVRVEGIDVLVRPETRVPVKPFDGRTIPHETGAFDVVLFVDVLHHTDDPHVLLREASRVARQAVVLKDHTLEGALAGPTLAFMDRTGNERHGVVIPHNYWTHRQWLAAFRTLGLAIESWNPDLHLYPWPADWVFGRSLHFVARLRPNVPAEELARADREAWEAGYLRFETPEEETRKFVARLRRLGAASWPRTTEVLELCCGRGNGLRALSRLGFEKIEGIDISPDQVARYEGPGTCRVGDARALPMADGTKDRVVVHGGLHHLDGIADVERALGEARRVLRDGGELVLVEPWPTPFLSLVHWLCRQPLARRLWPKLDALATMIRYEEETYARWLSQPAAIRALLDRAFESRLVEEGWGKLGYVGVKRPRAPADPAAPAHAAPAPGPAPGPRAPGEPAARPSVLRAALALGLLLHAAVALRFALPAAAGAVSVAVTRSGETRARPFQAVLDRVAAETPGTAVLAYWAPKRPGGLTWLRFCNASHGLYPRPLWLAVPAKRTSALDNFLEVPDGLDEQRALLAARGFDAVLVDGVPPERTPWGEDPGLVWLDREQDLYLVKLRR